MPQQTLNAGAISSALSEHALAACQAWLPRGSREGRWWCVGNIAGEPGDSLQVRLAPPGTVGKWNDTATGEHGDLLDILVHREGSYALALQTARQFLALPHDIPVSTPAARRRSRRPSTTSTARAARIWAETDPLTPDTHAWAYLANRGIRFRAEAPAQLRAHPALRYWHDGISATLPALVGRIDGDPCAIHRTWIDPHTHEKADLPKPRLALGPLRGRGVTLWRGTTTIIVAEGIETALSVPDISPGATVIATLSAGTLTSWQWPSDCPLLIIAPDNDPPGVDAARALLDRTRDAGLRAHVYMTSRGDWNDDLKNHGLTRPHQRLLRPDR